MRKQGYYRVRLPDLGWHVGFWNPESGLFTFCWEIDCVYAGDQVREIDENRIVMNDELTNSN